MDFIKDSDCFFSYLTDYSIWTLLENLVSFEVGQNPFESLYSCDYWHKGALDLIEIPNWFDFVYFHFREKELILSHHCTASLGVCNHYLCLWELLGYQTIGMGIVSHK